MKPAPLVEPTNDEERRLQAFDLREIDAADPRSHFALKYRARLEAVVGTVQGLVPPGGGVLEVGSAQSNLSLLLAERGYRAVALDLLPAALGYARKKHERGDFAVVCGAAAELPIRPASCDAVLVCELLEHCARPVEVLREAARCLDARGIMVITTHNNGRLRARDPRYSQVRAGDVEARQYGRGGEDHLYGFTMPELLAVTREAGLRVLRAEHHASMLHSDRLTALKRLMAPQRIRAAARLLGRVPLIGPLTSLTLLVVAARDAAPPGSDDPAPHADPHLP